MIEHIITLDRFRSLAFLDIYLWKVTDGGSTDLRPFLAMLASWIPTTSHRRIKFVPVDQSNFTRREYSALLTTVGYLAEQWVFPEETDARLEVARPLVPNVTFVIVIRDDSEKWDWWRREASTWLPRMHRLNRIRVECEQSECRV